MTYLFIRFTLRVCLESLSVCVGASFPHVFEGRVWDLIVLVPDHYMSFTLYRKNQTISLSQGCAFSFFHTQSRIRLEALNIPIFIDCKQAPSEMFKTSVI